MANEYVTPASLKATLELTAETYADADINVALEAASRAIDDHTNRRFYADADALQVRVYSPVARDLLRIDDLTTLTTLKTDPSGDLVFEEAWVLNTDFVLEPLNPPLIDGTSKEPWTLIRVHPSGSFVFQIKYPRTAQVTGKFGWAVVPPVVKAATTILAGRYLRRARETPLGVLGLGLDGTAVRISRSDPDVATLLARLVRFSV